LQIIFRHDSPDKDGKSSRKDREMELHFRDVFFFSFLLLLLFFFETKILKKLIFLSNRGSENGKEGKDKNLKNMKKKKIEKKKEFKQWKEIDNDY